MLNGRHHRAGGAVPAGRAAALADPAAGGMTMLCWSTDRADPAVSPGWSRWIRSNMDVEAGSVHAVIGPNGAGKTTLFNLISGIDQPSGGTILLGGQDITRLPAHTAGGAGGGADVPEYPRVRRDDGAGERADRAAPVAARQLGRGAVPGGPVPARGAAALDPGAGGLGTGGAGGSGGAEGGVGWPMATSGGWRLRGRWPGSRGCCCWTSRRRG